MTLLAGFRAALRGQVVMKFAEGIVLYEFQAVSWSRVTAAPDDRLSLRSPSVFKPDAIDLGLFTGLRRSLSGTDSREYGVLTGDPFRLDVRRRTVGTPSV